MASVRGRQRQEELRRRAARKNELVTEDRSAQQERENSKPPEYAKAYSESSETPIMYFPLELQSESSYPFTRFLCVNTGQSIMLPMPPAGVAFNDTAEYNTVDLGALGTIANVIGEKGQQKNKPESGNSLSEIAKGIMMKATDSLAPEKASAIASLATKRVASKNTHVNFQQNPLRQYTFNFKFVAKSQKESNMIRSIVETFRLEMYGELNGAGMTVQFPSPWIIEFYDGDKINEYLPHIKQCYLTCDC